jgi:hypothetical protein
MNKLALMFAFALAVLSVAPLHAKEKKWDIPCQKVFVTGVQTHEIAWALKGAGIENNLYKSTCMQPVADAAKADAILDVEPDPQIAGMTEDRIRRREAAVSSGDFWVSCNSDLRGSYCIDSTGYALETSCNERGCSSYYGQDPAISLLHVLGDALSAHLEQISAWAYMFSAKDHKLIWKYEGAGAWHYDLTKYSECQKKFGPDAPCKKPKSLLD